MCQIRVNGGRLRIVDLAGSERLRAGAASHSDDRLREAREINSSLAVLNECLRCRLALAAGRAAHVRVCVPPRRAAGGGFEVLLLPGHT